MTFPGDPTKILLSGSDRAFKESILKFLRGFEYDSATDTFNITAANLTVNGSAVGAGKFESQLLHVREEQAANTAGGTFTSGAWRTRVLNTSKTNEITGASLASNQITLPAGTYYIEAEAPAFGVSRHKAKLYNITDAADTIIGKSAYALAGTDAATTESKVTGRFTLAAQKVLELQHQCQTSQATNGLGLESNFAVVEVYSEVKIWKVA